jgi:hypothetical protein
MLAPSEQPLLSEVAIAPPPDTRPSAAMRRAGVITGALGFFCFLPYLAVTVGNTSAVQVGSMLTLLVTLPVLFFSLRRGPIWLFALIIAPLCIAALKVGLTGDGDVGLSLKTLPVWALSCLTIVAAQVCAPRYAVELLTGIAIATVLHALMGALQLYYFSFGQFPMPWLYVNPSFLSVQNNADTIARFTQRPFGLFPEPSAMSSSLAPWVLFWIAELCGIVRLRRAPATWQRVLFTVAAIGGLGLIILSRSGHAAITLACALVFVAIWFARCKATKGAYLAILAVFGVALPVALYFAAEALNDRLGGRSEMGNSSWGDRTDSLRIGLMLLVNGDLPTVLFGFGPGMTGPALERVARLEAVWSVLLTYVYETGMLGLLVVLWIGASMLRLWKSIRFDIVFAAIAVTWLVGITVTTSYSELLPIWMALGWLTVWPAVCQIKGQPSPSRAWHEVAKTQATNGWRKLRTNGKRPPNWITRRWSESVTRARPRLTDRQASTDQNALAPRRPRRWSER